MVKVVVCLIAFAAGGPVLGLSAFVLLFMGKFFRDFVHGFAVGFTEDATKAAYQRGLDDAAQSQTRRRVLDESNPAWRSYQ